MRFRADRPISNTTALNAVGNPESFSILLRLNDSPERI